MNARLLINKLPLSLGKIKPAEFCDALEPVGPITFMEGVKYPGWGLKEKDRFRWDIALGNAA